MTYCQTYDLPATISRCSNNYGPYQHQEKMIPRMIFKALADESMPVLGQGLNVPDWLYVEDHCRKMDLILPSVFHSAILKTQYKIERRR